jgi:hypothetical protein
MRSEACRERAGRAVEATQRIPRPGVVPAALTPFAPALIAR